MTYRPILAALLALTACGPVPPSPCETPWPMIGTSEDPCIGGRSDNDFTRPLPPPPEPEPVDPCACGQAWRDWMEGRA